MGLSLNVLVVYISIMTKGDNFTQAKVDAADDC